MKKILITGIALIAMICAFTGVSSAADTPQQVYAKYHKAMIAGDFDGSVKYLVESVRETLNKMDPSKRKAAFERGRQRMPRNYNVLKCRIKQGKADLLLSGIAKSEAGKPLKSNGFVKMRKQGGQWRIYRDVWKQTRK